MQSSSPSRKTSPKPAIYLAGWLVLLLVGGSFSGCAVLSIPSYRTNQCSALEADFLQDSPVDGDSQSCSDACETDECDADNYVPAFPTIPTPKCIQRWKAHRNLPEGPSGVRFHPLPTRPMFSPRPVDPSQSTLGMAVDANQTQPGCVNFGALPQGAQWIESKPTDGGLSNSLPTTPAESATTGPELKKLEPVVPALPQQPVEQPPQTRLEHNDDAPDQPSAEELPRPAAK